MPETDKLVGDFWGGLAAMLVALPSAIAFGVIIYSPLGGTYAAHGALAGILGATALGFIAAAMGGTKRLITAPCAPAAAVLSALAIELLQKGVAIETALLLLTVIGLLCGLFQIVLGVIGLGRLIKYMPYPVVSGYLSGVGLYIIASQVPKLLAVPKEIHFWESLASPALWQWQAIVVGVATIVVMVGAPKFTKAVPAAILGLLGGVAVYFVVAAIDPALRVTEKEMVRTLRAMSTGQRQARAVNNKDVKMWELDLSTLKSWCDETQVVDFEIIEEALKKQTAHGEKNGAA